MTTAEEIQALENALRHFSFPEKYTIFSMNKGKNIIFAIASNDSIGGFDTHSAFMSYDVMNGYLLGYSRGQKNYHK